MVQASQKDISKVIALLGNPDKRRVCVKYLVDSVRNGKIGVNEPLEAARNCTIFSLIAQFGDAAQLEQVYNEKKPDLSKRDILGFNAMHYAARGGNTDTFNFLKQFEEELDVDAFTNALQTPLMLAVMSRNAKTVTAVLEASARPSYVDVLGKNALWHAQSI